MRKLNAGSGPGTAHYLSDWTNVDLIKPNNGVQADLFKLPFPDNTFKEVRLIHVLEHVNRHRQVELLKEMHRVTAFLGVFYVEVPDYVASCQLIVQTARIHPVDHEKLRVLTVGMFGKQRHPGDEHRWGFTTDFLEHTLKEAGWLMFNIQETMISGHWKAEPIILYKAVKT